MIIPPAADLVLLADSGFSGTRAFAHPVAVGIRGHRIAWVAPRAQAGTGACPVAPNVRTHDFGSAFIMPGFHDAHLHFFHAALYASPLATMFVGTSEADCVRRLQAFAATRPRGSWLLAQGWREYRWDPPVLPGRASLDAAFPDQPVALYSGDAHTLWLNGCALRELGISNASEPPAGGSYDRDANGRLTGIVREAAAMELMPRIVDGFTRAELLDAYDGFQRQLNAQGVTAVCDLALSATSGLDFVRDDLFYELERTGRLSVRAHLFPTLVPGTRRLEELQAQLTGPLVRACGYKQFFDGVSSQHTAWLAEPYANARTPGERGRPTVDPQLMGQLVGGALEVGRRVRIHAIGDEAIHQALDIREQAEGAGALVLEHVENFQPADIQRLADLDVVASVQPRHITLDPGGPERDLGPERVPFMWPFRSLLDAGATLALGTDAPVTATDPLAAVYTAVTRRDADARLPEGGWLPNEAITVEEALAAYTAGSAAACGRAHELGWLAPGMLADVAVFDRDLTAVDPEDLQNAHALATITNGTLTP